MRQRPQLKTTNSKLKTAPLPFVLVNMAMSADGKIATANRAVATFSSARDHTHLYELRATADAVMSGARTVDLNNYTLGSGPERFRKLRLRRGLAECHLRVIVSGSGSVSVSAAVSSSKDASTPARSLGLSSSMMSAMSAGCSFASLA